MYIKIKKHNHFLNLLEDSELAQGYFLDKDVGDFNNNRLSELQDMLRKAKRRYNTMSSVLSITHFFKIENRVNIASKVEASHRELDDIVLKLEIFESNLAYLIISETITTDDCCKKNDLNPVYLRNLLKKYKKQIARPFLEYDYHENTGQVSEILENGKCIILPYIPSTVKEIINQEKKKQNIQDKLTKQLNNAEDELLNKVNAKIKSLSSDDDDNKGFVYKKRMTH